MTRRERITAILTEHSEGLPTPRIAELAEGDPQAGRRGYMKCYQVLREMEKRGEVTRRLPLLQVGTVEWCLVPAEKRKIYRARYEAIAGWNALGPADRPCSAAAFREFIDRFDSVPSK